MLSLNQTKKQLSTCNLARSNLKKRSDNCEVKLQNFKSHSNIVKTSIRKFSGHVDKIKDSCSPPDASLSEETIKSIKSCIDKKSIYYARDCITPYLKDLCIDLRANDVWYHSLEKSYIPFPNPNILEQFNTKNIQIDLFQECFTSYTPEHSLSKFSNFFSPQYYITFKDYQDLLGELQQYTSTP